jgi:hypothetical protein
LKLNPTKCSFGIPAGQLLGFLVSASQSWENPSNTYNGKANKPTRDTTTSRTSSNS